MCGREKPSNRLGSQFGDLLDFDEDTISLKRLDVARVKIVTNRLGLINDHLVIQVVGSMFGLMVVEDWAKVEVCREDADRVWEVQDSGGSDGEEVVGSVLGVQSEEEAETPRSFTKAILGEEVDSPRLGISNERMGQEEGQKVDFLNLQQKESLMGIGSLKQPVGLEHVAGGGEDCLNQETEEASVGPSAFNDPIRSGKLACGRTGESQKTDKEFSLSKGDGFNGSVVPHAEAPSAADNGTGSGALSSGPGVHFLKRPSVGLKPGISVAFSEPCPNL